MNDVEMFYNVVEMQGETGKGWEGGKMGKGRVTHERADWVWAALTSTAHLWIMG